MDNKIVDYLESILRKRYGETTSIKHVRLISSKPLRSVFLIEAVKENRPEHFILHVRQRSSFDTQEKEFNALNTALLHGVNTFELIHFDTSQTNPFGTTFMLETYIQGDVFLDRKDWFKQHPEYLYSVLKRLHRIRVERKSSLIPDLIFLPKYKTECLMKLAGSALFDVQLLEKMFDEVFQWQKEIDFSAHTSLLHGDLHYSNMIVSRENRFYLIDWEMASVGDYCKDLAYFKARTLDYLFPEENRTLFDSLMIYYKEAFKEDDLETRMRYYLSYQYLEIIWRCCFPKPSEQWLPFYFKKSLEYRLSLESRF